MVIICLCKVSWLPDSRILYSYLSTVTTVNNSVSLVISLDNSLFFISALIFSCALLSSGIPSTMLSPTAVKQMPLFIPPSGDRNTSFPVAWHWGNHKLGQMGVWLEQLMQTLKTQGPNKTSFVFGKWWSIQWKLFAGWHTSRTQILFR